MLSGIAELPPSSLASHVSLLDAHIYREVIGRRNCQPASIPSSALACDASLQADVGVRIA